MSWIDTMQGDLQADDLRRAFVMGASWKQRELTGFTMFSGERGEAEQKAEQMFPGGKLPKSDLEDG